MKKYLLIPALCLMCVGCNQAAHDDNEGSSSEEHSADWTITTKVKAAIMADVSLSASSRFVSVETTDGVVTLTGTVSTKTDKNRIGQIAKNVHGVKDVENDIEVSDD
jgi:hyperosmotically inducible protein